MIRYALAIGGIVQGVGFRPFLFREAAAHNLAGFVQNTSFGVYLEVEGTPGDCEEFLRTLEQNAPPLSRISTIERRVIPITGERGFSIRSSEAGERRALVSPDIALCDDCRRELLDPADRRYRYAFINCTNCGPRFSIVQDVPYDRVNTSMREFVQCAPCQSEYDDPTNRRFHAQPNACPVCGPALSFLAGGIAQGGDPIERFQDYIHAGKIVAVKGIGGYHLACDAANEAAVSLLRARKKRYEKPFAIMARDLAAAREFCDVSAEEEALLTGHQKPIVLLLRKPGAKVAPSVAPGNRRLGVMLPYTPLHCLLMERIPALVLTSGNESDRPMLYREKEALPALFALSDAVLTHNRPIVRRVDDSVFVLSLHQPRPLRRARGWAPLPLPLPDGERMILAAGAQQKNTFCLVKEGQAFLSSHIGDLDDPDTERDYHSEIASLRRLFDIAPEAVACDLHPDYAATRFARSLGLPVYPVQHHHAHFASVLAEHDIRLPAAGFIWDGTGYGTDGTIWGGETLLGTISASERVGHILPFQLPGGEAAIHEPWRAALSICAIALGREAALAQFPARAREAALLLQAADAGLNAPQTTSMGRLFDAVAALAGLREIAGYEGQAAIELEQLADATETGRYAFPIERADQGWVYDWRPLVREILSDKAGGVSIGRISMRFHRSLAELLRNASEAIQQETGCRLVALSGGCFQNELLLALSAAALTEHGFTMHTNHWIPCNDGGISYGQAAVCAALMKERNAPCASPSPEP
ncbi:MAG: carbamoyltransferase HypF [Christensenella sp.]|nr:carbamoyltransferase HypF [Christensenella sp.]